MKSLTEILTGIKPLQVIGAAPAELTGITMDSRAVQPGFVFVAVKGTLTDGHQYISQAIEKGAAVVVMENLPESRPEVVQVQVADSAEALGIMAGNWFGNPSRKLKLVAVTGTNGKTTVTTLLYQLFTQLGYRSGLISTVENRIGEEVLPSTHTTPDAVSLQALLARMHEAGCTHVFMEASSHAIHQRRIAGLDFDVAVFTNITHDHLDYHGTFENYIQAKKMLFDGLKKGAACLVNVDDKRGKVMVQNTQAKIYTYSLKSSANFRGRIISNTLQGLEMEINQDRAWFRLVGDFNGYNLVAAYGVAEILGEQKESVLVALSDLQPARGRFERLSLNNGATAVVDYAHTPDALQNVLETLRFMLASGQDIITVVGCGGDRDKAKRPIMAQVAARLSQQVILTSDNPRSEEPEAIIMDMLKGVPLSARRKVSIVEDREAAIREAVGQAKPDDVVLIAGKGHETYQEIKGVRYPFDDKEIVLKTQSPVTR